MRSVGPAESSRPDGDDKRVIRLVTKCATVEDFVRLFHPFADPSTLLIPSGKKLAVGTVSDFVIALKDKRPVMKGRCEVIDTSVPRGTDGATATCIKLVSMDAGSKLVHRRLLDAKKAAAPKRDEKTAPMERVPASLADNKTPTPETTPPPETKPAAYGKTLLLGPRDNNGPAGAKPLGLAAKAAELRAKAPVVGGAALRTVPGAGDDPARTPPPAAVTGVVLTPSPERVPGASYQLPANPFSELSPEQLASFVECTLFEEAETTPPPETVTTPAPQPIHERPTPVNSPAAPVATPPAPVVTQTTAARPAPPAKKAAAAPARAAAPAAAAAAAPAQAVPGATPDADLDAPISLSDLPVPPPRTETPANGVAPSAAEASPVTSAPVALPEPDPASSVHDRQTRPLAAEPDIDEPPSRLAAVRQQWSRLPPAVRKSAPFVLTSVFSVIVGYGLRGSPPAAVPTTPVAAERAAPSAPKTPPRACALSLTSEPAGARVLLDGQELGTTPLADTSVPCGTHALVLEHPKRAPLRHELSASEGAPTQLALTLPKQKGKLVVTSVPPGALIKLDRWSLGKTPRTIDVDRHETAQVSAELKGYAPWSESVTFNDAETTVTIELEPLANAATATAKAPRPSSKVAKTTKTAPKSKTSPKRKSKRGEPNFLELL